MVCTFEFVFEKFQKAKRNTESCALSILRFYTVVVFLVVFVGKSRSIANILSWIAHPFSRSHCLYESSAIKILHGIGGRVLGGASMLCGRPVADGRMTKHKIPPIYYLYTLKTAAEEDDGSSSPSPQ